MRRTHLSSTVMAIYACATQAYCMAGDLHWQPRIVSGVQLYTLNKTIQTDNDGAAFSSEAPVMVTLGLGGSLIYDQWYIDTQFQRSHATSYASPSDSASKQKLERADFSVSIGHVLPYRISAFVGYKLGSTTTDENFVSGSPNVPPSYSVLSFSSRFVVQGPFAGLSYGIPLGENSMLSANLAYGLLTASLSSNLPFPTPDPEPAEDADSSGFSYGATLKTAFYKNYLLSNSLVCQRYRFSFELKAANADYEVKESLCSLGIGLGYGF